MPKVLIAAAGGRVARRVAAALCARSEPPRALMRDANKARDELVDNRGAQLPVEMVVGDFAERDGLRRALAGVEVAFLALGSSLQQVELEQHFIDVAAEVGLPHLVKLSAADARSGRRKPEMAIPTAGISATRMSSSAQTNVDPNASASGPTTAACAPAGRC